MTKSMRHQPRTLAHRLSRRAAFLGLGAVGLTAFRPHAALADVLGTLGGAVTDLVSGALTLPNETELGNALYRRVIALSGGAYRNAAVQRLLQRIAEPLIAASSKPELQWEAVVLDDNTVNAWSLPGGKLAVNKGLLRYAANEHELAAVIAHEIGHIDHGHAIEEMKTERFASTLSASGRDILASSTSGGGAVVSSAVADVLQEPMVKLATSGYSREAERQADAYILKVFAKTGHDARKAPDFFRTLTELAPHDTTATTSLFSTYPDTMERITLLERAAAQAKAGKPRAPSPAFAELKATFPTRMYYRRQG
jgi:beta-barrel assembly-enhancing protease